MTFEGFDKFQAALIAEVVKMRDTKGKEYANDADRFANFRRLASQIGMKDYQVGWVYGVKHLDAIASFMKSGKEFSSEGIRGRIVDAITYLTLIAGMIEEAAPTRYSIRAQCHGKPEEVGITIDRAEAVAWAKRHHDRSGESTWVWNLKTGETVFGIARAGGAKTAKAGGQ